MEGGRYVVVGVSASVAVVINWRPAWRLDSAVDRSILVLSVRKWRCCRWTNTSSGRMSGARERERRSVLPDVRSAVREGIQRYRGLLCWRYCQRRASSRNLCSLREAVVIRCQTPALCLTGNVHFLSMPRPFSIVGNVVVEPRQTYFPVNVTNNNIIYFSAHCWARPSFPSLTCYKQFSHYLRGVGHSHQLFFFSLSLSLCVCVCVFSRPFLSR